MQLKPAPRRGRSESLVDTVQQPPLTFEEHLDAFRAFLRQQGRPDVLLWVHAGTIRGFRTAWCYRPNQSHDPVLAKCHFELARHRGFTIRLVSYGTIGPASIATVEVPRLGFIDGAPQDSGIVAYSLIQGPIRECRAVSSTLIWYAIRLYYHAFVRRQCPDLALLPPRHTPDSPNKSPETNALPGQ